MDREDTRRPSVAERRIPERFSPRRPGRGRAKPLFGYELPNDRVVEATPRIRSGDSSTIDRNRSEESEARSPSVKSLDRDKRFHVRLSSRNLPLYPVVASTAAGQPRHLCERTFPESMRINENVEHRSVVRSVTENEDRASRWSLPRALTI